MATLNPARGASWLALAVTCAVGAVTGCPGVFQAGKPCPSGDPDCKASPGAGAVVSPLDRSAEVAARASFRAVAPLNRARFGFAFASHAGRVYVFGGGTPGGGTRQPVYLDSIEVYDPLSDTWSEVGKLPVPRFGAAAAAIGDKIVVAGGAVPAGTTGAATDSVMVFDPATRALTPAAPLPYAAWGLGLVALPTGGLLAAGGLVGPPLFMADIEKEGPIKAVDAWTRLPSAGGTWESGGKLPDARGMATLGILGDAAILVGGRTQPFDNMPIGPADGRIFRFIPPRATWQPVDGANVDPQSGGAAAQVGFNMFLIAGGMNDPPRPAGGSTTPAIDPNFSFGSPEAYLLSATLSGLSKAELPPFPGGATQGGAAALGGKAYVFGGLSGTQESPNALAEAYVLRTLPSSAEN